MLYGKIRKFGNLSKLSPFLMSKISPKKLHINKFSPNVGDKNIARIANTVQCHNYLSGNKDCYETRFSIVSIVISVSNVTSPYDRSFRVFSNGAIIGTCDICDTDYNTDN